MIFRKLLLLYGLIFSTSPTFFSPFRRKSGYIPFFSSGKAPEKLFPPKYRGTVLLEEVAEVAGEIIRETCKELDIEIIDMAMNVDHVHLFIKNPFRKEFTKKCFAASQSVGHGWDVVEKYISGLRLESQSIKP
jgi:hypothetical protein